MGDKRDHFDRTIGMIDGLPGVRKTRPSTVAEVSPLLGDAQTFVVQTYSTEDGFLAFVQMIDAEGGQRFVLPPKVTAAIYRQRESLIAQGRKARGKERWQGMTEEERAATVTRLRREAVDG